MKSLVAPPGGLDGGGALVIETETERVFCGASLINIFFEVHCIAQSVHPSLRNPPLNLILAEPQKQLNSIDGCLKQHQPQVLVIRGKTTYLQCTACTTSKCDLHLVP